MILVLQSEKTYSINITNLVFDYIAISFANSQFRINSIAIGKSSRNYEIKTIHAKCENTWLLATDKEGEKYLAGENITISSNNIISAKDTTYSAGQGISIDANNTISVNNINEVALYESPQKNIRFGIDSDGNYGYYKDGADTVTPFKTGGVQPDDYNSKRLLKIWGTDNGVMTLNPRFAMSQLFFNTDTNVTLILAFKASDIGGWSDFFSWVTEW